jgi:hypothetical protein
MREEPNGQGLSRKAILSEIDHSLRRLGTDYVDLYQIRPCSLVAMTTSSRSANSLKAPPRISSLLPMDYTFAVSRKLTPNSRAVLMIGRLFSSLSTHL